MDKLKMAIDFFLSDQYDTEENLSEAEDKDIIDILIRLHANVINYSSVRDKTICPFINYGYENSCSNISNCKKMINDGTNHINCFKNSEEVYRNFYETVIFNDAE